jgi:hypothetical protein
MDRRTGLQESARATWAAGDHDAMMRAVAVGWGRQIAIW